MSPKPAQSPKFLPTPKIPEGLEQRVLAAVHAGQQESRIARHYIRQLGIAFLGTLSVFSIILFALNLAQSGFQAMLGTAIGNYDTVPPTETALALLETLPLGSLTLALGLTAGLCFLWSVQKKQPKPFKSLTHALNI